MTQTATIKADRFFQASKYHSRQCRICLRDYLFPFYGGRYECNDCIMTEQDARYE